MAFDWAQLTADLKQRYEGTYVFVSFPAEKKEDLFYVEKIESTRKEPIIRLRNNEIGQISLNYDTGQELSFRFPEIGYSLFEGKVALYYRRLSARRWKRGVSADNSQIVSPYNFIAPLRTSVHEKTVRAAFEGKTLTWVNALIALGTNGALSIPLTRHLVLGLSPTRAIAGYVLWFDMKPIGTAAVDGSRILVREEPFRQEVLDYVKKGGLNAEVI